MTTAFSSDVLDLAGLRERVSAWQRAGERVALCHGCFDLLHIGHVLHLRDARLVADRLVVTVTPDDHVEKGEGRPVFTAEQRAGLLAALRAVDAVAINSWPSAVRAIELLRPNFFIKGPDYRTSDLPAFVAERHAALAVGAEVRYTEAAKLSSSEFIRRSFVMRDD